MLCAEAETAREAEQPDMGWAGAGEGQAASGGGEENDGTGEREESTIGPIQPAAGQRAAGTVRMKFSLISVCSVCDYTGQSSQLVRLD